MRERLARRRFFEAAGAFAVTPALAPAFASAAAREWPPSEGAATPKLCLGTGASADEKEM